jgi:hypothetical protein
MTKTASGARAIYYDSKDDRREIWRLLARLPPWRRVAFLARCCRAASIGRTDIRPGVGRDTRRLAAMAMRDDGADLPLTNDIYSSLFYLELQYSFDLDVALRWLVESVRNKAEEQGFGRG